MEEWIGTTAFIEADVIRWTEGVFGKRRSKAAKAPYLGKRQVTAEVLSVTKDGWVRLLVRAAIDTPGEFAGRDMPKLELRTEIKRKRSTIERGKPERLVWSDKRTGDAEDVRSAVTGQASSP